MSISDRIKRAIAFYSSVIIFLISLPILLSYALGYHLDLNVLAAYKTGIIYITSYPPGASIYINGKLNNNPTPAQIEGLRPGVYKVNVSREGFYSWQQDLVVRPNMVTRADRIVLFPIALDIKKVSIHQISDFVISNRNNIYYMTHIGLFRSNLDGSGFKKLSGHSDWPGKMIGKKFSPDGDKFLYFTENDASVVYLNLDKSLTPDGKEVQVEGVLKTPIPIIEAFWYSGSNYITVVTEEEVKVVELEGGGKRNIISLYKFDRRPTSLHYDEGTDSLYFADAGKEVVSKDADYLYRIELRRSFLDYLKTLLPKKEGENGEE